MQLRDAKATLSALVDAAERGEPTTLTRHGKPAAMIVPMAEGEQIYPVRKTRFIDHLLAIPEAIDVQRDQTPLRDVDL